MFRTPFPWVAVNGLDPQPFGPFIIPRDGQAPSLTGLGLGGKDKGGKVMWI